MKIRALKVAIPLTIPILTGYLFLGLAYGFLMHLQGFGFGWTALVSAVVFAGSMQYIGITLLTSTFHPVYALLLTLMINARHLFYGVSMLSAYKNTGRLKPFLIFGLVDETFSINCSNEPPEGVDKKWFYFFTTLLNYLYWVSFTCIGSLAGNLVTFNTKGIEFVLTALFVVIFINQWREQKRHDAALIGLGCSVLCLLIFGGKNFMVPAMLSIVAALIVLRKHIEREEPQG